LRDRDDWAALRAELGGDPRFDPGFVEYVPATDQRASILLAGVVHDHPASVARVRQLVGAVSPTVLALELPAMAVGLFRQFATTDGVPPENGGEMSAAIQASPESDVVGIDAPSWPFCKAATAAILRGEVDLATLPALTRRLAGLSAHAVTCRLGAIAARLSIPTSTIAPNFSYQCSAELSPTAQADHEATHLSRTRSLFAAVEAPAGHEAFTSTREAAMCQQIETAARRGTVVAVVGFDHLDAVADALRSP
jgi:hypothetical protein